MAVIPFEEVKKHNKIDDCWTVVKGRVYDITKVLKSHPGGFSKIYQAAGKKGDSSFGKENFSLKLDC